MKTIVILLTGLIPMFVNAQTNTGIQFQNIESWEQVLQKAKENHKNIFVDAYATWCGPCKEMDAKVYTDSKIGDFVNNNFIAIKLQFDQTDKDPEAIKRWYTDTKYLMATYSVEAFPTFLFIAPDGTLLQKNTGYQDSEKFLAILEMANDPQLSYAGQVKEFKNGKITGKQLLMLSIKAKEYHQDSLANEIAQAYKRTVIDQSQPLAILDPNLPAYIVNFHDLLSIHDPLVRFMYHKPVLADSLMKIKGYARKVADNLISNEMINPITRPGGKYTAVPPDWRVLENKIAKKYDAVTAKRLLINAKLGWYNAAKDWPNIIKYNIEQLDNQGLDTVGMAAVGINNLSYNIIFQHSNDPYALNKAVEYMEILLKNSPKNDYWLDTYANLLYKVGRKEEAIKQEQMALSVAKEAKSDNITLYQETIKKMQDNLPTWE